MAQPVPFLRGPLDGKYHVERVIGEGGMGMVVEARHSSLGTRYALKILMDADDPVLRERFLREAQASASLKSPHTVRVFDVGALPSGEPYLVMELLEGCDLHQLVAERGALPPAEAVGYVLQTCDALAEAHGRGMVHRDIKPANLFLCRGERGAGIVKLLDFGISKAGILAGSAPRSLTETGSMLGTPHFMAPEQLVSSRDVDARADIWSLGATLFELLSGEVPFDGQHVAEIFAAVVRSPPRSLRALRPEVPAELERVVTRCLEKDPGDRYASVADLVRDLSPFHADGRHSYEGVAARLLPVAQTMAGPAPWTLASPAPAVAAPPTATVAAPPTATVAAPPIPAPPAVVVREPPRAPASSRARPLLIALAALAAIASLALPIWWLAARDPPRDKKARPTAKSASRGKAPPSASAHAPAEDDLSDADRRLPEDVRREVIALLDDAETKLAGGDEEGARGGAKRAHQRIRPLIEGDEPSLLVARATSLSGETYKRQALRDAAQGNIGTEAAALASSDFAEALEADPGMRYCPLLGMLELHLANCDHYAKVEPDYPGYGSVLFQIDGFVKLPIDPRCIAKLKAFRETVVARMPR
jgi:serine/threonine-protein kinase